MRKPLKWLLWSAAVLLLLLVIALTAAVMLFDPNNYRAVLGEEVQRETGRSLALGHIALKVFPWLRVDIEGLALGNAPGFGEAPMLTVQRANLGVKLWPLLMHGRVDTDTVELQGLKLALAVAADGRSNWDDLLAWQRKRPPSAPLVLDVAGIRLEDASIGYSNAASGQQFSVQKLQLRTGRFHGDEPFDLALQAQLLAAQPAIAAEVQLKGRLSLALAAQQFSFTDLQAKLAATLAAEPPLAVEASLNAPSLRYSATANTLQGAPLKLHIANLRRGTLEAPQLSVSGDIALTPTLDLARQQHQLAALTASLQLAGSAVPGGKPQALQLAAETSANLAEGTARIEALQLAALGLKLSGNFELADLAGESLSLSGPVALAPFNPRSLMAALGIAAPKTADAKALTNAQLSARISASAQSLKLQELDATLDATQLRGSLSATLATPQRYAFQLTANALDADRYLPPATAVAATPPAPVQLLDVAAAEGPLAMLEALDADGSLRVGELRLKGAKFSDVLLRLDGQRKAKP